MEKLPETKEKFLISVRNDIQAALVENLLREQNIHCSKRHKSVGSVAAVYTGMSNLGVDVFVNENDYERAADIIKIYDITVSEEDLEEQAMEYSMLEENDDEKADSSSAKMKKSSGYGFAAIFFIVLVLYLVFRFLR